MSEKFREQSQDEGGGDQIVNDEISKEPKGNKISRRNFLKGISAGFAGTAIGLGKQENALAVEGDPMDNAMWLGALKMKEYIEKRAEPLPDGVVKYLIEFGKQLQEKPTTRSEIMNKIDELQKFCLIINKATPDEGKSRMYDSLSKKPTKELIVDLSDWALDREARLYVKKRIVPDVYKNTVIKFLEKKDFEGARNIIENIILKNLFDATKKENIDSSIAYLRNSFNNYGQGFLIPPEGYAGNLKIWAYIAESLNDESDYWHGRLNKMKK